MEGAPGGRPAFFCEAVSALDGGRLPSGAGLGCRGAAGIVKSSGEGGRASPNLLDYRR